LRSGNGRIQVHSFSFEELPKWYFTTSDDRFTRTLWRGYTGLDRGSQRRAHRASQNNILPFAYIMSWRNVSTPRAEFEHPKRKFPGGQISDPKNVFGGYYLREVPEAIWSQIVTEPELINILSRLPSFSTDAKGITYDFERYDMLLDLFKIPAGFGIKRRAGVRTKRSHSPDFNYFELLPEDRPAAALTAFAKNDDQWKLAPKLRGVLKYYRAEPPPTDSAILPPGFAVPNINLNDKRVDWPGNLLVAGTTYVVLARPLLVYQPDTQKLLQITYTHLKSK
jgi:hypothetical protein